MKNSKIFYFAAIALTMAACSEDDDTDNMTTNTGSLELNITLLEPVAADERYEGWIIVDGSPVSTGLFTVGTDGTLSQSSFEVDQAQLNSATDFVLTIEPYPDTDPAPSKIKVLGGAFNGTNAMVSVAHGAALGNDFNTASGSYILATPTTNDTTDERSGVWFLDPSSGTPMATLNLPALPAEWVYEGWAVIDGVPVSTGRFSSVMGADDAAPYSGTDNPGPPFPGEDFVMNAPAGLNFPVDLSGAPIVISIEPEPDNSPAPFAFKPLFGMVPANAAVHSTHSLNNQISTNFPSGTVMR